jgi:hypothetical protein
MVSAAVPEMNNHEVPAREDRVIENQFFQRLTVIFGITGITIAENSIPGKGARFEIAVPKGMWRKAGNII